MVPKDMQVVLLCGGEGIRLKSQNDFMAKAMVFIDDKPMLWHVMKRYSLFGHNEFILALGKYAGKIRDYFLNYNLYNNDIEFRMGEPGKIDYHSLSQEENWKITLVNTGEEAHTGARLARCKNYLKDDFMLSYADCLSNVDLDKLLKQHKASKKTATVTGVMPPFRYGEFIMKGSRVSNFLPVAKLKASRGYVNGGFMVLSKKIFNFLSSFNECTLENEVFQELIKKNELEVYKHDGFWQCLDNDREFSYLKKLCQENKRYWLQK